MLLARRILAGLACNLVWSAPLNAQRTPISDTVLARIWQLGMHESRIMPLAQVLLDSIGPRLTASAGDVAARNWLVATYRSWGIPARNEPYGTWLGWERGDVRVDLVAPRKRALSGSIVPWSPGTPGPVEAPVVMMPRFASAQELDTWLPRAREAFVLTSAAQLSCRLQSAFERFGLPGAADRASREQATADSMFTANHLTVPGLSPPQILSRLASAGVKGRLRSTWSPWGGTNSFIGARSGTYPMPVLELSCEDYGLLFRLAENNQSPRLRLDARANFTGEVSVANTIAEIRGSEKPDEYIILSAHFDSWDGASGATDDGAASVTTMEAMRILHAVYPRPRRTILAGHWNAEEMGAVGSRVWIDDHPEVTRGLHAMFNQDNGTGRIDTIATGGLVYGAETIRRWLAQIPSELSGSIGIFQMRFPFFGTGRDEGSFGCSGAPAFALGSAKSWDYGLTQHTTLDTYDKLVAEDLRRNATLLAMLVYVADREPSLLSRERRPMPPDSTGQPQPWPTCEQPQRKPSA